MRKLSPDTKLGKLNHKFGGTSANVLVECEIIGFSYINLLVHALYGMSLYCIVSVVYCDSRCCLYFILNINIIN